ncbi:hypothetical protein Tco_1013421 [Tanacetum coccineum]
MRKTIDSLLSKTINELTNQSFNFETLCPRERIKELKLRTKQRNAFEEELFKDMFPTEEELAYHKELLGEPCPPFSTLWPKIRRGDPWSLKIPCVIGTVYTGHAYIDLQSPVNIMSRAYYNKIKEKSFQARRNPYQPYKFCNFVGRAKNVHIFIGYFVYVIDFMILEDLGNIIDSSLCEVVLGKPFAQAAKFAYDESLGLIMFAYSDDEVMFRMPQRTKELDLVSRLEKDKFKAFFVESLKVGKMGFKHVFKKRKRYYKACMNLELLSSDLTNKIACRKFLIKNEEEFFTVPGDSVGVNTRRRRSPASGGGLILYQAYGNLYAMTGRKAHLLEDKHIPSVGVFDENANPSSTLGYLSQQPPATTHTELIARVNKLLKIRQTIESLLSKTINELTNQSSDFDTFCPRDRIKELEIRTKQRNNFEEELFKDMFPTEEELAYHKELLGRKAHLLKDKQIPSVGVFDEVFSTWMTFRANTRDDVRTWRRRQEFRDGVRTWPT